MLTGDSIMRTVFPRSLWKPAILVTFIEAAAHSYFNEFMDQLPGPFRKSQIVTQLAGILHVIVTTLDTDELPALLSLIESASKTKPVREGKLKVVTNIVY
eukprot:TRINITY_DN531_c0_g1_i3.p3 TRINITY_DN531_c0_g1~~TRINITY_DN531_c0_g1_i3.p3  ORF type:complete len:100 (+),score=25.44 TRINITY_DN531_c0_g1_i3:1077-1376(+)